MTNHPSNTPRALAAVFMLLLLSGVAQAAPPVHQATGGGTVGVAGELNTIAFTAQIDDAGAVKGQAQFRLRNQDLRLHVDVDGLSVLGNEAWIGDIVTPSNDPARIGTRVLRRVQDNGDGGGATDQTSLPVPGAPGDRLLQSALPLEPWTHGNVQVK